MFRIITLALLLAAPGVAAAWSAEGHRIICEIAWQRFTPRARALVLDLRRNDPQARKTFSDSCVWADQVKGKDGPFAHTYAYHFVNVPNGSSGYDPQRDCPAPKRCAPWAVSHYTQRLRDPSLPKAARAEALKFVSHFVGDLHQPLHAGRAQDRGGNSILVDFFGDYGSCETRGRKRPLNLHAIWDHNIVRRAGLRWPKTAETLAAAITTGQAESWNDPDPSTWTNESFRLCESFVYDLPETVRHCWLRAYGKVTPAYYERALAITQEQLQKAGVRLAALIDAAAAR